MNEIIKKFTENNKIINSVEVRQNFVDSLPRLWLEWLAVMGFILLILLMIFQGKEFSYIVPLLGLFAAAAFRLMPSLTRIMNSVHGMLYYRATVDTTFREFNQESLQNNINEILGTVDYVTTLFCFSDLRCC